MPLNGFRVRPQTPPIVIPAKAGIHALTSRERMPTATPPHTSTLRPYCLFPAKAHPEPRYGAGIQRGVGGANFHTLVCRQQPACAIAMKACPGLRSGIDRSGSLSFAIRRIPSPIRPPIRHSGEGRNPEGRGGGDCSAAEGYARRVEDFARRGACPPLGSGWGVAESAAPTHCTKSQLRFFIPWCAGASRDERLVRKCAFMAFKYASETLHSSFPRRRESTHQHSAKERQPRYGAGIQRGVGGANFHTLVCRQQPACAIAMKIDRSGSLSCAIRGIPSPIRPPIRHSGGGRNPEGRGGGDCSAAEGYARRVEDFARRGACPPLGSGWGVAEPAVPIRCTKPQIWFFITWCAGGSRDERLL